MISNIEPFTGDSDEWARAEALSAADKARAEAAARERELREKKRLRRQRQRQARALRKAHERLQRFKAQAAERRRAKAQRKRAAAKERRRHPPPSREEEFAAWCADVDAFCHQLDADAERAAAAAHERRARKRRARRARRTAAANAWSVREAARMAKANTATQGGRGDAGIVPLFVSVLFFLLGFICSALSWTAAPILAFGKWLTSLASGWRAWRVALGRKLPAQKTLTSRSKSGARGTCSASARQRRWARCE